MKFTLKNLLSLLTASVCNKNQVEMLPIISRDCNITELEFFRSYLHPTLKRFSEREQLV